MAVGFDVLSEAGTMDKVRALAERAGMPVERWQPHVVPKKCALPETRWRKTLRINGKNCLVRDVSKLAKKSGKDRVIVHLSDSDLRLADFLVLYVHVPGYPARSYVVPTRDVRQVLRERKVSKRRFSIPLIPTLPARYGTIAWERCRGAWHLLCMLQE